VKKALPPLVVALSGSAVAFFMVTYDIKIAAVLILPVGVGWLAERWARRVTLADPVGALRWYGWAQLQPYGLAIAFSAGLIGLTVWLVPPAKAAPAPGVVPPEPSAFDKYWPDILKVVAGALSTFVTAAFIKSTEDPDRWVADLTKDAFQETFTYQNFPANSDAELALRSPNFQNLGWDAKGRQKRAAAIASALPKRA
jgi:hypothetical protein